MYAPVGWFVSFVGADRVVQVLYSPVRWIEMAKMAAGAAGFAGRRSGQGPRTVRRHGEVRDYEQCPPNQRPAGISLFSLEVEGHGTMSTRIVRVSDLSSKPCGPASMLSAHPIKSSLTVTLYLSLTC